MTKFLQIGDVFMLPDGALFRMATWNGIRKANGETARFLVEDARYSGGGSGHGQHDIYPDGWHVTARQINIEGTYDPDGGVQVMFYQSGAFDTTNTMVFPVIGRMKRIVSFGPMVPVEPEVNDTPFIEVMRMAMRNGSPRDWIVKMCDREVEHLHKLVESDERNLFITLTKVFRKRVEMGL